MSTTEATLLSIAGKILAKVLLNRLNVHLDQTGFIPENQYGFREDGGMFYAMLMDAFQESLFFFNQVPLRWQFRRLKAKPKMQTDVLDELLYADDMDKNWHGDHLDHVILTCHIILHVNYIFIHMKGPTRKWHPVCPYFESLHHAKYRS